VVRKRRPLRLDDAVLDHDPAVHGAAGHARGRSHLAAPNLGPNDFIAYERVDSASDIGSIAVISRATGSVPCLLTPDLADNRNPAWSF
jgi:hypothetical protein